MSTLTHDPRPSVAPPVPIKSEFMVPDDYMNEVQDLPEDLRRRSSDSGSSEKQSDSVHRATNGSSPGSVADKTEEEMQQGEERLGRDGVMDSGTNGTGHTNGSTGPQQQVKRPDDGEEAYDSTNSKPINMVQGEGGRSTSSRDDVPDDSKFFPDDSNKFSPAAPDTPECNSQSEDMLAANNDYFQPCRDREGNLVLDVDCGSNSGFLYINKLCQGSKGQSIYFNGKWFTPNEFQYISGRETAKDWKRSIRHRGKSLKILMSRGLLSVHTSAASECSNCKMNMAMSRVRYSEKKSISNNRLLTVPSSTTMSTVLDKSHRRSVETDSGSLNHIISQLHQTNGFASDSSRKRVLLLEMGGDNKRPRSASSMEDDIYEEQQRRIFEAANSPEPQMIENMRRSLNISTGDSGPSSPASLSPPSLEDQVNGVTSDDRDFILRSPQSLTKHQNKSSRKQNSPQHIDLTNSEREANRSPHVLFGSGSTTGSNSYHKQSVMRPRYHSQAYNLSRNSTSNPIFLLHPILQISFPSLQFIQEFHQ
ncbi:uncharacterized protein [Amphiura filiformis]|uniref:uncharacterized protein isoform X2 n=1 Tax=Amphiura filiformis TaxID=82378 RepID=UPI003B213F27